MTNKDLDNVLQAIRWEIATKILTTISHTLQRVCLYELHKYFCPWQYNKEHSQYSVELESHSILQKVLWPIFKSTLGTMQKKSIILEFMAWGHT